MKSNRYFDNDKSLIENAYYFCMVVSILFILVQVFIARNSLENSSKSDLTRHTIEQLRHYEASVGRLRAEYQELLLLGGHCTANRFYRDVAMEARNVGELNAEELSKLELIDYRLIPNAVNSYMLLSLNEPVIVARSNFVLELDNMAATILEGLVDEQLFFRRYGNFFLQGINTCATLVYHTDAISYNPFYGEPQGESARILYDIWWHRRMIEQKEFIIAGYRDMLSGNANVQELARHEFVGLYAEGNIYVARKNDHSGELSDLTDHRPNTNYKFAVNASKKDIKNGIEALESEIREHKRAIDRRLRGTAVRGSSATRAYR